MKFIASLCVCLSFLAATGQVFTPGSYDDQVLSFLDLKNGRYQSDLYNYSIRYDIDSLAWNPWKSALKDRSSFSVIDPQTQLFYNSTYARGYNDGPVWKGKGVTLEVHGGIMGKIGKNIHYTLQPAIFLSQNSAFKLAADSLLPSNSRYNYKFTKGNRRIDFVQRYGSESFGSVNWGQSEIRFIKGWFTTAISTQNFSIGPSEINPILLSKNAPGIPNLHLGTARPIDIVIKGKNLGSFETHIHYGFLKESDYMDDISNNDYRYLNGISVGYSPSFLEGFSFGLSKVLYKNTRFFEGKDLYSMLVIKDDGVIELDGDTLDFANDTFDQLASFFAQYHSIKDGLKIYLEFAKNDFNGKEPFFTEPQHARAFTVGLQKLYEKSDDRFFRILFEHSTLIRSNTSQYRGGESFYIHNANIHGYTNQGQILGAGTGPGSDTDYLSLDWIKGSTMKNLFIQRINFNEDYFLENIRDKARHDSEYTLGYRHTQMFNQFVFSGQLLASYRFNRYYNEADDVFNIGLGVSMRYLLK